MIPQLLTVRVHHGQKRPTRLWIPLLPVFVVASPVLLVVAFTLVVACFVYRTNPGRALAASWHLLAALRGLHVEIQQGRRTVLVNIN